ncbi:ChaN family lipoprotein [Zhengella sp. ZM62]|uniref:ChaN family lipoprotein n=1 Tax=Zhengella sedimenti TaxID=3390035 RepID=UPI00397570D0
MIRSAILAFTAGLALASPAGALDLSAWQSAHFRDNPLNGTIAARDGKAATVQALLDAVGGSDFVAVGEIHDNPDHHRIQAEILQAMVDAGKRPAVVFEMVPAALQSVLDKAGETGAEKLGDALEWEKRGWPAWSMYRPVAEVALAAGLPLVAGDLDRDVIRAIGRQGSQALQPGEAARIGLDLPFAATASESLKQELVDSHCGMMPEAMIAPMITVQRARDGALAAAMAAHAGRGAFLVAGAGHVREDRGAPAVLAQLLPGTDVLTIGLRETGESRTVGDYTANETFDFVILTPRANVEDHCAGLRERFAPKEGKGD